MDKYKVYLLLGSNMGNREDVLGQSVNELIDRLLPDYLEVASLDEAVGVSNLLETEPWGFESPDKFLNQAFCCITDIAPKKVLEICLEIERELGRIRDGERFDNEGKRIYKSRVIDIDILLIEKEIDGKWVLMSINETELIVPHPRLKEREFAMKPLREIYKGKF